MPVATREFPLVAIFRRAITRTAARLHKAHELPQPLAAVGQNDNNECADPYWQAVLDALAVAGGDRRLLRDGEETLIDDRPAFFNLGHDLPQPPAAAEQNDNVGWMAP